MRISDWSSDVCSSDLYLPVDRYVCRALLRLGEVTPRVRHWRRTIVNNQFEHGSCAGGHDAGTEELRLGHDQAIASRKCRPPDACDRNDVAGHEDRRGLVKGDGESVRVKYVCRRQIK